MNQVLLLVSNEGNRASLTRWLEPTYRVLLAQPGEGLDANSDCYIVDYSTVDRFSKWLQTRREESQELTPVLLVASRGELKEAAPSLWEVVDEVIIEPLDRLELKIRVAALIRTRQLSIRLQENTQKLVRTTKAVESTSDAINIADVDGTSVYLNQAFIDLYGFTVDELNRHGTPQTLFVQLEIAEDLLDTVRQGQSWHGEAQLKTKSGHQVPTLLRADTIEDSTGKPVGFISIYTNISELKRIQAAEREHRLLAEALRDIGVALTSTLNLDEVLNRILDKIEWIVPFDTASIMLIEAGMSRVVRHRDTQNLGGEESRLETPQITVSESPHLNWMVQTNEPLVIPDTRMYAGWESTLQNPLLRAYIGIPIRLREEIIGFINLESATPGFFALADAERLQAFAEQAAIAIANARLYEKAQTLAALEERQRLAHNLHDAVSQTLFSANVIAEALPRLWERHPEKVWPRLNQLQQLTTGALAEMRTLLMELRPSALLDTSLNDLLQQLVDGVKGRSHINVTLDITGEVDIPSDVHIGLYYITQEALNNVLKHARASTAIVKMVNEPEKVTLQISDNGQGFNPADVAPASMGLAIMRERADSINASLHVQSKDGQGTVVEVWWTRNEGKDAL